VSEFDAVTLLAKLVEDDDKEEGEGVSRELEREEPATTTEDEEGVKRLSNEAARFLALPLLTFRLDREVVLDHVFEQLSMTIDVTFLPVVVVVCPRF